jgi:PIN domain nuclease of toxin-antitoxin system
VRPLAIGWGHGAAAGALPPHHADPFDRLLIAQAQIEGMRLVTEDRAFRRYDVDLL